MTSRGVTLVGYALIAMAALALEVTARRSRRLATFGDAVTLLLRHWPVRILVLTAWVWLGWHLFVRVDWR